MKASTAMKWTFPLLLAALIPWAFAQQTTPSTGSGGTGGSGTSTTPPKVETPIPAIVTPPRATGAIQIPTVPEIIYIAGTVMQEDGNPPPFGTVIELDCGDTITREATVDSTGRFGFQVGSNNRIGRVQPDPSDQIGDDVFDLATESRNLGSRGWSTSMRTTPLSIRLLRCEVRAQYPEYRSTSSRMKPGAIFGYTEVDAILLYRIEKVRGTSVSLTSILASKEARKSVGQAEKALKKGEYAEAEALLKSALESYPENAAAWYLLGEAYHLQNRDSEAQDSYLKSVSADKIFVRPYLRLARLALKDEDWESAIDFSSEALQLDPIDFPEAYYLNALANYHMQDMEEAEKSARKGQRLDLNHQYPQLHLILANILSMRQDAAGSMEEMRKYLKAAPDAEDAALVRARLEEKEDLARSQRK